MNYQEKLTEELKKFKQLEDHEIRAIFDEGDNAWPLSKMIFLVFGCSPDNKITSENGGQVFARSYQWAKTRLYNKQIEDAIVDEPSTSPTGEYIVRKSALIEWAKNELKYDENIRVYKIWKKYKLEQKKDPNKKTVSERASDKADEMQFAEYEKCQLDKQKWQKPLKKNIAKDLENSGKFKVKDRNRKAESFYKDIKILDEKDLELMFSLKYPKTEK